LRGLASSVRPVHRVKVGVRRVLSGAGQKSRALQGRYIGFLRQIPEGDRKRFQDLARNQGREAAIAALRKRLGK